MTIKNINVNDALNRVEKILAKDKNLSAETRVLMELLVTIVNLLVERLNLNSTNSSKPPSQDPYRKRSAKGKKIRGKKRKQGGQKGHKGQTLGKVENPDHIEEIPIDQKTLPYGQWREVGFEARQVIDIEIKQVVTEYRAQILENEEGIQYMAEFPKGIVNLVQYGKGVKSHSVYMSQFQLIPYDRIQDHFGEQLGNPISKGSIFNFNKGAYNRLEEFEQLAQKKLLVSPLIHSDETGINVNGKRLWLHTASNHLWTLLFPHEKRGKEATEAMGILPHYQGVLCHDHWPSYFQYSCLHSLCNAHHLRELEFAFEHDNQKWAKTMQDLLVEINEALDKAGGCLKAAGSPNPYQVQ